MKEGEFFWPVFLILVGVVVLLLNFGILPPEAWRFWPFVLIIPGLIKLSAFGDRKPEKK